MDTTTFNGKKLLDGSYTGTFQVGAGLIHILLVIALVVGLIQLFSGRRVV